MTQTPFVERVGAAVERQQRLAVAGAAHGEIALHLRGVEHMQRPGAVVGHEVGDIDQRVDRAQADRGQTLLQPFRRWPVLDAAHQPQREAGAQSRRLRWSRCTGQGNSPLIGLIAGSLNLPMSAAERSRAMPCTPVQSCRFGVS
jgi:hypothetical protein